jgi:hypothetical protein
MKLNDTDYELLASIETSLQKAKAGNNRPVPRAVILRLKEMYKRVTGFNPPPADSCGHCELELKQRLGAIYFADKAEREGTEGKAVKAAAEVARMAEKKASKAASRKKEAEV